MRFLPIDAATYERSALHRDERIWPETNCYVDLWIEVLHALGHDPRAGLAFTLSADHHGDQWQFIKYQLDDLRDLYALDVHELNPWRGLDVHIEQQLREGNLLTAEVDAWHLPDTAGVSYRIEHTKTSIVANMIDTNERRLGYFHGASYYELEGEDFDGVLARGGPPTSLAPYVERIHIRDALGAPEPDAVIDQVRQHLSRRPVDNPATRLAQQFVEDLPWLQAGGVDRFHQYAFATMRQCGSCAELAASLCDWLEDHGAPTGEAQPAFLRVAELTKTMQFKLARAAAGRAIDHESLLSEISCNWQRGIDAIAHRYG